MGRGGRAANAAGRCGGAVERLRLGDRATEAGHARVEAVERLPLRARASR